MSKEYLLSNIKVDSKSGCWVWQGCLRGGYGRVKFEGRKTGVHRVSYRLWNGTIPAGHNVLHKCDNPPCINPRHLFTGTDADNNLDCRNKGRLNTPRGVRHTASILTAAQAWEVKHKFTNLKEMAARFGVSISAISKIRTGKNWK